MDTRASCSPVLADITGPTILPRIFLEAMPYRQGHHAHGLARPSQPNQWVDVTGPPYIQDMTGRPESRALCE